MAATATWRLTRCRRLILPAFSAGASWRPSGATQGCSAWWLTVSPMISLSWRRRRVARGGRWPRMGTRAASLRQELDQLLGAEGGALRRYTEFEVNYKRLNTPEIADLFSELDALRERIGVLNALDSELADLADALSEVAPDQPASALADLLAEASPPLQSYWKEEVALELKVDSLAGAIRQQNQRSCRRGGRTAQGPCRAARRPAYSGRRRKRPRSGKKRTPTPRVMCRPTNATAARARYEQADRLRRSYLETFDQLAQVLSRGAGRPPSIGLGGSDRKDGRLAPERRRQRSSATASPRSRGPGSRRSLSP